jgi:2,3-dimethylmalate lyase
MLHPGARLREAMISGPLVAPGAHDPLTARLIEQAGFPAVYVTGGGITNGIYGQPDVGIVSYAEMLEAISRIVGEVDLPVIVDGDTGYGGPANVRRAVRELESAGAAAVHIEDQVFPKRCAYLDGASTVSLDEMRSRLEVALDARREEDFLIIGRTEARMATSFDDVLERAVAYKEVGADVIFVNGISDLDQVKQVREVVPGPLLYNNAGNPESPHLTATQAEELGYDLLIFPSQALRTALVAVRDLLTDLRRDGDIADPEGVRVLPWTQWVSFTGVEEVYELEATYAADRPR